MAEPAHGLFDESTMIEPAHRIYLEKLMDSEWNKADSIYQLIRLMHRSLSVDDGVHIAQALTSKMIQRLSVPEHREFFRMLYEDKLLSIEIYEHLSEYWQNIVANYCTIFNFPSSGLIGLVNAIELHQAPAPIITCDIFRDIVSRVIMKVNSEWRTWQNGTVCKLAQMIYNENKNDDHLSRGILADALEEAGCTDERFFDHLRGTGPHYRGCWVIMPFVKETIVPELPKQDDIFQCIVRRRQMQTHGRIERARGAILRRAMVRPYGEWDPLQ